MARTIPRSPPASTTSLPLPQATNRPGEAEPLMRRMVGIFLQFTRDTGHQHSHLKTVLNNYRIMLMAMGASQDVTVEKIGALAKSYGVSL